MRTDTSKLISIILTAALTWQGQAWSRPIRASRARDGLRPRAIYERNLKSAQLPFRDKLRSMGMPNEQIAASIGNGRFIVDVYNWNKEPLSLEQVKTIVDVLKQFSIIANGDALTNCYYIFIDNQPTLNPESGREMDGEALTYNKSIWLYPQALRAIPSGINGVSNLKATLIHELSHNLTDPLIAEWRNKFGWVIAAAPGRYQIRDPGRLVNHHAAVSLEDDICESMIPALENPRILDPDRLRFLNDRFQLDGVSEEASALRAGIQRFFGDSISLPDFRELDPVCGGYTLRLRTDEAAMSSVLRPRAAGEKSRAARPTDFNAALYAIRAFSSRDFNYDALCRKIRALLVYEGPFETGVHIFVRTSVLDMAHNVGPENYNDGKVLGLAGEISGLYEVLIKRSSSLKNINLGRLESLDTIIYQGRDKLKEFDAISDNTVFEFKFHLTLRKLYQQVIGMNSRSTPHLKVLTERKKKKRFRKIHNMVYFGEADDGYVVKALTEFIKQKPELKDRVYVTPEGGISVKLTLPEMKDFLYSPQTIACARREERAHRLRFLPKDFSRYYKTIQHLIDAKISQLKRLKFDVIIAVSKAPAEELVEIKKIFQTSVPSERLEPLQPTQLKLAEISILRPRAAGERD